MLVGTVLLALNRLMPMGISQVVLMVSLIVCGAADDGSYAGEKSGAFQQRKLHDPTT